MVKNQSESQVHQARFCWRTQGNTTHSVGKAPFPIPQFLPPLFQAEKLERGEEMGFFPQQQIYLTKKEKELGLFGLVKQDWRWEKMTLYRYTKE